MVLLLVLLLLLASRRWDQLVSPQVWDEDGPRNIHDFLAAGVASFLQPVNGYLLAVPKLISAAALEISFSRYPLVSTLLAWGFIAFVGMAIALSPSKLRGRAWCALAVFLVPTDPEVFGLPVYTFWWAALLLFLLVLWDEERPSAGWRIAFLLLGGLSSPAILLTLPALYWRAWAYRKWRVEWIIAGLATVVSLAQTMFTLKQAGAQLPPLKSIFLNVVPAYLGRFLVGNATDVPAALWLAALVVLLAVALFARELRRDAASWLCMYLLVASIAVTVVRVDPAVIHPRVAGPRYFFFPFIALSWLLVQMACTAGPAWKRAFVAAVGIVAVINAVPVWSRRHDDLRWTEHALSCRRFENYDMPVHWNGRRETIWTLPMWGSQCAQLLDRDLLLSGNGLQSMPTFPYVMLPPSGGEGGSVVRTTMQGTDLWRSRIPGFNVIGSYQASDADVGEVYVKLRRGESLRYRTGPRIHGQTITVIGHENQFIQQPALATEWVKLVFSNSALPAEFTVRIADEGRGWGEWSAIAVPEGAAQR